MSSDSSDVVAPLQPAVTRKQAPIRGHRPSVMGSLDLADESRDTVEMKDSDDWYRQFAPSATLQPAKKLDRDAAGFSGLNALLANRMPKSDFETRFLGGADLDSMRLSAAPSKMAAKEASGESLFNRSAKLGALLANRPEKSRLESLNIIKAPQGGGVASGAFAGMQAKLEASKKKDKLNSLLSARPEQGELLRRGLLLDEAKQTEAPKERLASAKNALGGFFASRPNPEQLVKQKIITDIGDLPGGLERKQENQLVPQIVSELEGKTIVHVSLGFSHTLALDSNGVVYAFGSGANGRLGLNEGSFADVTKPTPLPASHFGGEPVTAVDAGENHSAAITAGGRLYTWGTGAWGRLGLGNQDDQSLPKLVELPESEKAQAVSAGAYHTLVLTQSNKLYSFGWNKNGRCGLGRKHPSLLVTSPVLIPTFNGSTAPITRFEAGAGYSYALLSNSSAAAAPAASASAAGGSTVYLWGTGSFGGLGFGEEQDVWEPKILNEGESFDLLAIGATHTLASGAKGTYSWGANEKGQLGRTVSEEKHNGDGVASPVKSASSSSSSAASSSSYSPGLIRPERSISLAAGKSHSFSVDASGVTSAWGMGSRGILGLGEEQDVHVPTVIPFLSQVKVKQVDAAWTHSAVVTQDGKLYTFGAKNNGRLGY